LAVAETSVAEGFGSKLLRRVIGVKLFRWRLAYGWHIMQAAIDRG
jgi:hypothetical protein